MNDAASVILTYIRYCLENTIPVVDRNFDSRSYSLWAAYEILNRLQDNPSKSPIDIMEDFVLEMTVYSNMGKNELQKDIFRIAADAGDYLISLVSCPEGE